MNPNLTMFERGTALEVRTPGAISRATENNELERLKARLLRQTLNQVASSGTDGFILQAAKEAAALAWSTRFPLLVFPTLFDEKVHAAEAQMRRQISVRRRSPELVPA